MQGNLFHGVIAQVVADLVGYEFVRSPVGAVAADVVVMRYLLIEGVATGFLGQAGKVGGIKNGHVWQVRPQLHGGVDANEVRWVVQRRQVTQFLNLDSHLIVHDGRSLEMPATLDDTVTKTG